MPRGFEHTFRTTAEVSNFSFRTGTHAQTLTQDKQLSGSEIQLTTTYSSNNKGFIYPLLEYSYMQLHGLYLVKYDEMRI